MKTKVTTIVLFVVLALVMAVSVSAEMATSAFVAESSVLQGHSFTIYIDLSGAPNAVAGGASVSYDADVLEFSSGSWGFSALITDFDEGDNRGVFACDPPMDVNGSLLSMTFTVKEDAPLGSTSVSCSVFLVDEQDVSLSDSAHATITVIACEHSGAQPKEEIPSSCTVPGVAAGVYCDNCAAYVSGGEQLPLADHSYGAWINLDDTAGHWHECSVCGAWDYGEHHWDDGVITTPATENAPGEKLFSCYDCGQTKTVEIPMLSHTHAFGETWKNNADQHWHECACGEKQQTAAHAWNETVTKPATCEETGVKTLNCTVCGATKTEDIPLAEHSWDAGTVTTEATEQATGVMTHICTVCRESKTEVIPVLEHTHATAGTGEWSSNDTHHWLACSCGDRIDEAEHTWEDSIAVATCESKGLITYTCVICGYTLTEDIAQLEHTWNEGEVTTEPTEDAAGVKTYTCTSCGKATRTEDIPQLEKAEEPEQPERPGVGGPFLFLIILLIGLLIILLVFFLYARKKDRYN